ncbi:SDR family NAD(P)-dependent oxidoreductase [Saccharomonospora azurea]|uniref:Short-chain alcohol dehydrogenase like protein n=1 Tax=Saccharomonospora azurea NA-128 TaxID=882081 RepID=H8G478_9PSEU|nr:SDR family oxidoreductase [Saccharomonospora azurea]EHY91176.1 dehydrogenase of unknown specificity [Saccharomonospora azurea NA-128]
MTRFAGKAALVTGGGSGIGRAIAIALAKEGAAVAVTGRDKDKLAATVGIIQDSGGTAIAVPADVTIASDAAAMVEATVRELGGLHIAVNSAGVLPPGGQVADISEDSWHAAMANLNGTWLSMKYEISHMRDNGGGAIVNLSSAIGSQMTMPYTGAYAASKAGVSVLTRTAAKEYISAGIRVNAVSPGPVETPMSLLPGETEADRAARLAGALPIGRAATVEEVASAVLWLAADESGFTVGHDLVLDGAASN